VVPLLIRLLFPKMRKRSGRLGGKGESGVGSPGKPPADTSAFPAQWVLIVIHPLPCTARAACLCGILFPTLTLAHHWLPLYLLGSNLPAGAPGSARAAILNFLAAAEPSELRPLFELFLGPLSAAFVWPAAGSQEDAALGKLLSEDDPDRHRWVLWWYCRWQCSLLVMLRWEVCQTCWLKNGMQIGMQIHLASSALLTLSLTCSPAPVPLPLSCTCRLIEGPWWGACLGHQSGAWWLQHIDAATLNAEPLRRRIGYLNTLEDLLKHLGHRMQVGDVVLFGGLFGGLFATCL